VGFGVDILIRADTLGRFLFRAVSEVSSPMNQQKIHDCVEALCQSGCDMVRATIGAIESGQAIAQTQGLAQEEEIAVLRELRTIMAVYDQRAS
jgi:hypothetical protein